METNNEKLYQMIKDINHKDYLNIFKFLESISNDEDKINIHAKVNQKSKYKDKIYKIFNKNFELCKNIINYSLDNDNDTFEVTEYIKESLSNKKLKNEQNLLNFISNNQKLLHTIKNSFYFINYIIDNFENKNEINSRLIYFFEQQDNNFKIIHPSNVFYKLVKLYNTEHYEPFLDFLKKNDFDFLLKDILRKTKLFYYDSNFLEKVIYNEDFYYLSFGIEKKTEDYRKIYQDFLNFYDFSAFPAKYQEIFLINISKKYSNTYTNISTFDYFFEEFINKKKSINISKYSFFYFENLFETLINKKTNLSIFKNTTINEQDFFLIILEQFFSNFTNSFVVNNFKYKIIENIENIQPYLIPFLNNIINYNETSFITEIVKDKYKDKNNFIMDVLNNNENINSFLTNLFPQINNNHYSFFISQIKISNLTEDPLFCDSLYKKIYYQNTQKVKQFFENLNVLNKDLTSILFLNWKNINLDHLPFFEAFLYSNFDKEKYFLYANKIINQLNKNDYDNIQKDKFIDFKKIVLSKEKDFIQINNSEFKINKKRI